MIDSETYLASRLDAMSETERAAYEAARSDTDLALEIAQVVYDARTAAGMTQAELAKAMGVTQSYISGLEGGGSIPNLRTLAKVAAAVGRRVRVEIAAA